MARIIRGGVGALAGAVPADPLGEARAQAQALLAEAREQAARIEEAAREAARAAGEERAAEVQRERLRLRSELEGEVVGLALAVAARVLEVAVEDPRAARESARRALRRAAGQERLTLHCHPADAAALRAAAPELCAPGSRAVPPEVRADAGVGRGGVLLETEAGTIDARVERQLQVLARQLEVDA